MVYWYIRGENDIWADILISGYNLGPQVYMLKHSNQRSTTPGFRDENIAPALLWLKLDGSAYFSFYARVYVFLMRFMRLEVTFGFTLWVEVHLVIRVYDG